MRRLFPAMVVVFSASTLAAAWLFSPASFQAFGDIDNDGDQDLLVTGQNNNIEKIAKLYLNDGNGNFAVPATLQVPGLRSNAVELMMEDVEGDGDLDLFFVYPGRRDELALWRNDGGF